MRINRLVLVMCLLGTSSVWAQSGTNPIVWEEFGKRIAKSGKIAPLGPNFAGDQVSLSDGSLSFNVTDVSLPGNDGLSVEVSRSYSVFNRKGYPSSDGMLADWQLQAPNISGVFASDWWSGTNGDGRRCTVGETPPVPDKFALRDFWQGLNIDIPGGGDVLLANSGVTRPGDGATYRWVTSGQVHISCLTGAQPVLNAAGEGFQAVTPEGVKYTFNWMAQHSEAGLAKRVPDLQGATISYFMNRKKNALYATRVEDRFGNYIEYTYTNNWNQQPKLTRILANDGRQLTIAYSGSFISTVSDGSRTWTYGYADTSSGRKTLSAVTLPDGSSWTIDFATFTNAELKYLEAPGGEEFRSCTLNEIPQNIYSLIPIGTVGHPSGSKAKFTMSIKEHGRSNVPVSCGYVTTYPVGAEPGTNNDPNDDLNTWAISAYNFSLTTKEVSGPGLQTAQWTYAYSKRPGIAEARFARGATYDYPVCTQGSCSLPLCTNDTCAGWNAATITGPNGEWSRYTYGSSYLYNEGKLLKVESGSSESDILRMTNHTYDLSMTDQVYPARYGLSRKPNGDGFQGEYHRPLTKTETDQQAIRFKYQVNNFDVFARPTSVTRSSGPVPPP